MSASGPSGPLVCYLCFMFLMLSCLLIAAFVVTCWERANLLALLYVMFSCVFITFPCGFLGQVWYLIVLIPDLGLQHVCSGPLGSKMGLPRGSHF